MTPSTILTPLLGHAYVFDFQSSRLMFGYDIPFELMMILFIFTFEYPPHDGTCVVLTASWLLFEKFRVIYCHVFLSSLFCLFSIYDDFCHVFGFMRGLWDSRRWDRHTIVSHSIWFGVARKVVSLGVGYVGQRGSEGGKHVDYDVYQELGPERFSLRVQRAPVKWRVRIRRIATVSK
jgi:hypothetical protein